MYYEWTIFFAVVFSIITVVSVIGFLIKAFEYEDLGGAAIWFGIFAVSLPTAIFLCSLATYVNPNL